MCGAVRERRGWEKEEAKGCTKKGKSQSWRMPKKKKDRGETKTVDV